MPLCSTCAHRAREFYVHHLHTAQTWLTLEQASGLAENHPGVQQILAGFWKRFRQSIIKWGIFCCLQRCKAGALSHTHAALVESLMTNPRQSHCDYVVVYCSLARLSSGETRFSMHPRTLLAFPPWSVTCVAATRTSRILCLFPGFSQHQLWSVGDHLPSPHMLLDGMLEAFRERSGRLSNALIDSSVRLRPSERGIQYDA